MTSTEKAVILLLIVTTIVRLIQIIQARKYDRMAKQRHCEFKKALSKPPKFGYSLEEQLRQAVLREDYNEAARLRDILSKVKTDGHD